MGVMSWLVKVTVTTATGLAALNMLRPDFGEYVAVIWNRVEEGVHDSIPQDVKLERLAVMVEKMGEQVERHKYGVAKAKVDLEDAATQCRKAESVSVALKAEMNRLRSLLNAEDKSTSNTKPCAVNSEAGTTSEMKTRQALAVCLESYKQSIRRREALEQALEERRKAYENLETRLTQWQSERTLLAQRAETLKLRRQSQALQSHTDTTVFDDADLARATELAEGVERELRIVEAQQAIKLEDVADLTEESAAATDASLEQEVDQILLPRI